MSCTGCQASVEGALNNLSEISKVTIDLKKEEAIIELVNHVSVDKLQETLLKAGLHYTISLPEVKAVEKLVKEVVELAKKYDRSIATPAQAALILNLPTYPVPYGK